MTNQNGSSLKEAYASSAEHLHRYSVQGWGLVVVGFGGYFLLSSNKPKYLVSQIYLMYIILALQ